MSATELILLAHTASTWYMVGIIWFVQWVHYALFNLVGGEGFADYQLAHLHRTSYVVLVAMFIEAGTAGLLMLSPPPGVAFWLTALGALLVAVIWLTTLLVLVPLHNRMTQGYQDADYQQLIRSNWPRTLLWSLRGLLVLGMLAQVLRGT